MEYRAIYNDEYLSHHGVKGMRWGHRKDGGPQGYLGTYPKGTRKNAEDPETRELARIHSGVSALAGAYATIGGVVTMDPVITSVGVGLLIASGILYAKNTKNAKGNEKGTYPKDTKKNAKGTRKNNEVLEKLKRGDEVDWNEIDWGNLTEDEIDQIDRILWGPSNQNSFAKRVRRGLTNSIQNAKNSIQNAKDTKNAKHRALTKDETDQIEKLRKRIDREDKTLTEDDLDQLENLLEKRYWGRNDVQRMKASKGTRKNTKGTRTIDWDNLTEDDHDQLDRIYWYPAR